MRYRRKRSFRSRRRGRVGRRRVLRRRIGFRM